MSNTFTLDDVKKELKAASEEVGKTMETLKGELDAAKAEVKSFGASRADTDAKVKEIAEVVTKAAGEVEALAKLAKQTAELAEKHAQDIEVLRSAKVAGSDEHAESIIQHAKALFLERNPDRKNHAEFDVKSVNMEEVARAMKAFERIFHANTEQDGIMRLSDAEKKSLTNHGYSNSRFLVTPQISSRILSCFDEKTDLTGLVTVDNVSKGSVVYMVDKGDISMAGWQCDTDCLANGNAVNFRDMIGEKEIRVNSLRFKLCASRALLDDMDIDLMGWAANKVRRAFMHRISESIVTGDGDTKPIGFMAQKGGLQTCDVNTPAGYTAGSFTWQDLIMLKYMVNTQYHAGAGYLVNQNTLGKILTMSDANNRPIWVEMPGEAPVLMINGSPLRISTWMPDAVTGSTPVFFGDLKELYTLVVRRALTMVRDDITAPWCVQYNWETRVGGDVTCAAAGRLMRVG